MLQIKRSELKKLAQNKLGDDSIESQNKVLVMISTSLSARTSYTIVGEEKEIDYSKMIDLHDRLLAQDPPHSSPLEHCARAMSNEEHSSYLKGKGEWWEHPFDSSLDNFVTNKNIQGWCNNFKGFIPYRYLVDNKISI